MKAGALLLGLVIGALLATASATAAVPGGLVFDTDRCDQGGQQSFDSLPGVPYHPCQQSIFKVNADGSGLTRLTDPGNPNGPNSFDDFAPSWAPDGDRIVFVRSDQTGDPPVGNEGWPNDLIVMNADGTEAHAIHTGHYLSQPVWSPDGQAIAYAQTILGTGNQLKLIDPSGEGEHAITPEDFVWFGDTQWSFDGRRITGLGSHWQPNPSGEPFAAPVYTDFGIWSVDRDGSNFRRLTAGDVSLGDVAFSPDGRYLAISVWDQSADHAKSDIFTVRLDGSEKTLRSDVNTAFAPVWSPFGPTLFFRGSAPGGDPTFWGIRRVNLGTGGASDALTDSKWRDGQMSWSPLGTPVPDVPPDVDPPLALLGTSLGVPSAPKAKRLHAASAEHHASGRLPFIALDRSGIQRIDVAVGKRAHGRCRFLKKDGKLAKRSRCRAPKYVRFRGDARWRKLTAKLPKGTYEVRFRTKDVKGHTRKHPKRHVVRLK